MLTKLLLLLSKGRKSLASPGRSGRLNRPREGSFSMAMTMLVILALILGTIALANRNTSGLLGTSLQSRNREARDAAEAGIVQIITELNKERNRRLLVAGRSPAAWNADDAEFQNPCTGFDDAFATTTVQPPTDRALTFQPGTWINVDGAGGKQFSVVSIEYLNHDRSAYTVPVTQAVLDGSVKTLIRITVAGRVDGADATSQARVTREFEVVPKCCKRSFGYNNQTARFFGRDNRECKAHVVNVNPAIFVSLNGGGLTTSKNAFTIIDDHDPPRPVTEVFCREDASPPNPACAANQWTLGSDISVAPIDYAYVSRDFPSGGFSTAPGVLAVTSSQKYLRVDAAATKVELCNSSGGSCTSLTSEEGTTRYCVKADPLDPDGSGPLPIPPVPQFYCMLTQISASNQDLVIDTSNGGINLFFDNPGSDAGWSYTVLGGNGTFRQVYCGGGQSDGSVCTSNATTAQFDRLNLIANEVGVFDVRGTSSALAMSIEAPFGKVIWRGGGNANPNFIGRIWSDSLDIKGSIAMQVPASSPGSGSGNQAGTAVVDWAARSVSHSSSF